MTNEDLYFIKKWSTGYFDVNSQGNITVRPDRQGEEGDLHTLVTSLVAQGIHAPLLLRFNGILRDRIQTITGAFDSAIKKFHYQNIHQIAYPAKANPDRHVIDIVQETGKMRPIGLEVGSKPELVAILSTDWHPDTLLLCNGYKDREFILLALLAARLGKHTIITIEQLYELHLVLNIAEELGVKADIGVRMKLAAKGTGKWETSGGEHSKFGLTAQEIVTVIEKLQAEGKSHWLKLFHFHLGSQITTIKSFKKGMDEATRVYTEIAKHCPSLSFFDVGSGLAVDYDGSKSKSDSSMNYTVEDYASDIVSSIRSSCLAAGLKDPVIITETGRATVAHHSVLITQVMDVTPVTVAIEKTPSPSDHEILLMLKRTQEELHVKNCREVFYTIVAMKEKIIEEFVLGKLNLEERAYAETLCRTILMEIRSLFIQLPEIVDELEPLDHILHEIYFCNFSIFQSLPDSWAIQQLFPICPIHRLNEVPSHLGVLADLSCDSDGKINSFIGKKRTNSFLNLHKYSGSPYYLGIFLVGAYQEILGSMHNLFGHTHVVHAELSEGGEWKISHVVKGNTIEEVLNYLHYNNQKNYLNTSIDRALEQGRISPAESVQIRSQFRESLGSYTYLMLSQKEQQVRNSVHNQDHSTDDQAIAISITRG